MDQTGFPCGRWPPQRDRRGGLDSCVHCWARGGAEQLFGGAKLERTSCTLLSAILSTFFLLPPLFSWFSRCRSLWSRCCSIFELFVMFPCLQSFGCLFAPSTRTSDSVELEFIWHSRSFSALAMLENQHCAISLFHGAKSLFLTARSGVVCCL